MGHDPKLGHLAKFWGLRDHNVKYLNKRFYNI